MRVKAATSSILLGAGVLLAASLFAAQASSLAPAAKYDLITAHRNDSVGDVANDRLDPDSYLVRWDAGRTERLPDGTTLRTFEVHAINKEIEIAPGVFFPAWTYNGHVPGPTLRATEGDRIRIVFTNLGDRPHSMHFHGFHAAQMDGAHPHQMVAPNDTFVYEFDADPAGVHLYHCHATPLTLHISNGLYGFWIVDPKEARSPAREMFMMMNAFDPNFDEENEVYAVNTVANHYARHPIVVRKNELLRIYLANITEFDAVNSFHPHATFFHYYPTGTQKTPRDFTDIVILGQAERGIVEVRFPHAGDFMFHAHKTEFAERGWMGVFRVLPDEGEILPALARMDGHHG